MILPRFQGNAIKKDNGWGFEIFVSLLGEEEGQLFYSSDTYQTREEALKYLKLAIQDLINKISEEMPDLNINPNEYIDIKTNIKRKWNKKDEH